MREPRAQRWEEAGDSGDEQSDAEYLVHDVPEAHAILDGGVHRSFAKEQDRSQESCRRNKDFKEVHGLGRISGMSFKGGWGPDLAGGYMARQFGYVETAQGRFGVAIAAKPVDGGYASARVMLDDIAVQIQQHMVAGGVLVCS